MMTVVSSRRATHIDPNRSEAVGVRLLRAYLDFAEQDRGSTNQLTASLTFTAATARIAGANGTFGNFAVTNDGAFQVTANLLAEFGPMRIMQTPISEIGLVGTAVGAALTGMRPVAELMYIDFSSLAIDQIVNQAA